MFHPFSSKNRVLRTVRDGLLIILFATAAPGQEARKKINPYSPNPEKKVLVQPSSISQEVAFQPEVDDSANQIDGPNGAQQTFEIAETANLRTPRPTEQYKVGVGDVIFINLKNSPKASGYYTVRADGTIDFPLAGEHVVVADQSVETIEEIIASGITLYPDPQIEVKVRGYGSHRITVSGMVDRAGEKNLQREAMPLFVIRAEAMVNKGATKVVIVRAPLIKPETYDLSDPKTDEVLIYPGNSVEFTSDSGRTGFYFISGEVRTTGQKEWTPGLTLYQAVVAADAKGSPKKATVRRKNENGVFALFKHNLKEIKNGKAADPSLVAGDVIEIRN